jgi:carbonic anhydrase
MQMLIDHARNFPTKIAGQRQDFADLARGQQPLALFISCSDSRVMPSLITGSRPGELFELRTAGNIVPRYRSQAECGVAASIEFAVKALEVPDIVVCGHSHCGAVKGLMHSPSVAALPLVRSWLTWAGHHRRPTGPEQAGSGQTSAPDEDTVHVTQRHLVTQLDHLRTYPDIAQRLAAGRLRLHGWYYTVETGEVLAKAAGSQEFRPL